VQAVADRNVDQTVFAADRNGWLGTKVCQRKEPAALTAAQDDRKDVTHRDSLAAPRSSRRWPTEVSHLGN
jgi:hypothetical protein